MKANIILFFFISLLVGCSSKQQLQNVHLVWKPTSDEVLGTVPIRDLSGVTFAVQEFSDERTYKKRIGENIELIPSREVTTIDNVGKWSTAQFIEMMKRCGLKVYGKGDITITGEIFDFKVIEDSMYKARVAIRLKAEGSSGIKIWEGLMDGTATRYGRSYSLDNYYETITDALIHGFSDLMNNTNFLASISALSRTDKSTSAATKHKDKVTIN